ncbi:MAG: peptide ABC transporter substrate-binding protein [Chloroflexi bacterium]|nr:peptide ABC transporter substrate-binding protein [Chloroflexota bacterium]
MRWKSFLLWGFMLLLLLSACTTAVETAVTPTSTPIIIPTSELKDRSLRLFWWQAPKIINPHLTRATADRDAARLIYEPLASFNGDDKLVPVLATEIPSVRNGLLDPEFKWVRWQIPAGLKWSDGHGFTAHDIKFTYDFIIENGGVSKGTYSAIESIDVLDLQTVQINFKDVNPAWELPFVGSEGLILPGHIFSDTEAEEITPVGTGPYQLESYNTEEVLFLGNQLVTTVKLIYTVNLHYRNADDLYFERIEMDGGGTANEAASAVLEFGDVDFAYNLQLEGDTLSQMVAGENSTGQLLNTVGGTVEQISVIRNDPNDTTYNTLHPFFSIEVDESNANVRQAIAHAIDKEAISALYGPTGEATNAMLVAPADFRSPRDFYPYDLDAARQLLADAGWVDENGDGIVEKDGRDLSITYRTNSNALRQDTQSIIQESLQQIGIDVKIDVSGPFFSSNTTLPNTAYAGTSDILMFALGNNNLDPTSSYLIEWTCGRIPTDNNGKWVGLNTARWCNEAYDALYNQSLVEINPTARAQLLQQMNDMLVENVVVIPLVSRPRVSGVSHQLDGVNLTPWDSHLWNVHEWRRTP